MTPALALRRLGDLASDIRAAIVLDAEGSLAAVAPEDEDLGERLRELTLVMLETAERAGAEAPAEVEVATPAGAVYVVRDAGAMLAVVAGRFSLSSLMRYDLRRVLAGLASGGR